MSALDQINKSGILISLLSFSRQNKLQQQIAEWANVLNDRTNHNI